MDSEYYRLHDVLRQQFFLYRRYLYLALSCLLASCSQDNKTDRRYEPQLNPKPQYFVTMEGLLDPKLLEKGTFTLGIAYVTHNDDCRKIINPLEGVYTARVKEESIIVKIDQNHHYGYKIPIDKYLPGYCQWEATAMYYIFRSTDDKLGMQFDVSFTKNSYTQPSIYQDDWKCNISKCYLFKELARAKYLNLTSNYKYIINVEKE